MYKIGDIMRYTKESYGRFRKPNMIVIVKRVQYGETKHHSTYRYFGLDTGSYGVASEIYLDMNYDKVTSEQ